MGQIIDIETDEIVFESDDPAAVVEKQRELDAAHEWTGRPRYAVLGFDSGELHSGEVRDDAPHDLPPDEPPYDPPDEPPAEAPEPAE